MIICEHTIEEAIRTFFREAKMPRPSEWNKDFDLALLKASVSAFIKALREIENVEVCYGFDESKIF